jgi:hypothetical protein
VPREGRGTVEVEASGQAGDAGQDLQGRHVEVGAFAPPRLDDAVDVVAPRLARRSHGPDCTAIKYLDIKINGRRG